VLTAIREVQIPLVAIMLLGGGAAKLARALRSGSVDAGLGPTALVSMRLRRPTALTMCAIECGLGLGLIVTAGRFGTGAPATCVRLGSGLLFLVATSALIELRETRPDVGCGCFGDFSTAPVSGRTMVRSALLAVAALSTIDLRPVRVPDSARAALLLVAILCIELVLLAAVSPEVGEGLIRLGYSEPCELRDVPSARTFATLRRSKQWRRYSGLITADVPADVWRELCWRYVIFPSSYEGRAADLVFAVFLKQRRPTIHVALVDAATGQPLPWPTGLSRRTWRPAGQLEPGQQEPRAGRPIPARVPASIAAAPTPTLAPTSAATPLRADIPFSTDLYSDS